MFATTHVSRQSDVVRILILAVFAAFLALLVPAWTVCHALRNGRAVVNVPLMYPQIKRASSVTITDPIRA